MNPTTIIPINHTRRALAVSMAALITATCAFGQAPSAAEMKRLQDENAALRARLAEFEARLGQQTQAATTTTTTTATTPAVTGGPVPASRGTLSPDSGVMTLSPFEVKTEKDYGYLKTNSATATRIGMEIQKVPLSISVLSEDFIKDTGMREIQDVLRYSASAAGDTRMGVKAPGNSATPSGSMTLRGFPVSSRLRNGIGRYSYYNMDSVERVEIIKGPAAVFFGQGFPGGVINYVTKKPQFSELPTVFSYSYGGNEQRMGTQRATLDYNRQFNDQAAFRMVGAFDNFNGSQRFEYKDGFSVNPSITLVPFANRKLKVNLELEHADIKQNLDAQSWIWPDQWFADYTNPRPQLIAAAGVADAAAYRARIYNNSSAWIGDVRTAFNNGGFDANNNYLGAPALFNRIDRGAFYNNTAGGRVHDEKFNYRGRGSLTKQQDTTIGATVDYSPTDWLDARYVYTRNFAKYNLLTSSANPYADGNTFNAASGLSWRGDERQRNSHQVDFVIKKEFFGVKHKILTGGILEDSFFKYRGASGFLYTNIPGATDPLSGVPANLTTAGTPTWGLSAQRLFGRDGTALTSPQVFSLYDPALHTNPDIGRITMIDRGLVDMSNPRNLEWYVNYLGTLLNDRLNVFAGYRRVKAYNGDQRVSTNAPWYNGQEDMLHTLDPNLYLPAGIAAAGTGPGALQPGSFYLGTYNVSEGDSMMFGASFDITKDITVYASHSQTFLPNSGNLAIWSEAEARAKAAALGLNPDTEITRIKSGGADTKLSNEDGINTEIGVKASLWDNRLVGTFSLFRLERTNEKLDDSQRQIDEPLNYAGPNKSGAYSANGALGSVRWYSNSSKRRVEGAELEGIWTPIRNYQVVASTSWQWTAKTVNDPSIADPNKAGLSVADKRSASQRAYFAYQFRMPNVPEYRVNVFNKYTFTQGPAKGLTVAGGARYSSVMNISNDTNYDSKQGGVTAGDYLVFDANVGYPWKLFGYRINSSLQVSNLLNKEYNEGSGGFTGGGAFLSPPRTWMFTNTLTF